MLKKICHVTSAHPEEDGRIFRRAAVSTALAGYDTYLVQKGNSYEKQGVKIVGIGEQEKSGRLYRMTAFAKKAYEAALEIDADLYQLHDPELLPYALKLKRKGKAVVFDSHENYVEQTKHKPYLSKPFAVLISIIIDVYMRYVFRRIDGLTYPGNDHDKSPFDNLCARVVSTDNFPWLSELYDQYDENIVRESNTACYVGGLDSGRGITQIIQACSYAGCKLYLAGHFHSDEYKRYVMNLPEYSCVHYLGTLNRKEITDLLQKAEIGLCTLLNVGQYYAMRNLPTKVYEYMSMGMPVIMNDSEYNCSMNDELHFGVVVDPLNIKEMSKSIREILDNREKTRQLGSNGREAIKTRFCWDKEQEKLINMYRDILVDQ